MKRMKDKSDIVKDVNDAIEGGQIQAGGAKFYLHSYLDDGDGLVLISTNPEPYTDIVQIFCDFTGLDAIKGDDTLHPIHTITRLYDTNDGVSILEAVWDGETLVDLYGLAESSIEHTGYSQTSFADKDEVTITELN